MPIGCRCSNAHPVESTRASDGEPAEAIPAVAAGVKLQRLQGDHQVELLLAGTGFRLSCRVGNDPVNARATFDDVRDGLSSTLLVVESAGRPQVYRRREAFGTLPTNRVNGGGWSRTATDFGLDGASRDGTTFPGTCAINCTNGEDIGSAKYPYASPYGTSGTGETYSFHVGGSNVLLGDGSVRFANEAIDIRVYGHLVTRDKAIWHALTNFSSRQAAPRGPFFFKMFPQA